MLCGVHRCAHLQTQIIHVLFKLQAQEGRKASATGVLHETVISMRALCSLAAVTQRCTHPAGVACEAHALQDCQHYGALQSGQSNILQQRMYCQQPARRTCNAHSPRAFHSVAEFKP
jgi:hypothetical protein